MTQGRLCTDAITGHPFEAQFNQVSGLLNVLPLVLGPRVGKHDLGHVCRAKVMIALQQLHDGRLTNLLKLADFSWGRHAFDLGVLQDLDTFVVTWEERSSRDQLKEDAACRPDVNAAVVLVATHDELGCPVVSRHYVGCVQVARIEHFCSAKVSDLELSAHRINHLLHGLAILDKNVLWLQVTVRNALRMHVLEPVEDLLRVVADVGHLDGQLLLFSLAKLVLEAALAVLHHDVLDKSLLFVKRVEEVDHLHDVGSVLQQ